MKNTQTKKNLHVALSKRESKLWKVISYALIGIQAVLSIATIITLIMLDMLPGNYLFAIVIIIIMLWLLAYLLMFFSLRSQVHCLLAWTERLLQECRDVWVPLCFSRCMMLLSF